MEHFDWSGDSSVNTRIQLFVDRFWPPYPLVERARFAILIIRYAGSMGIVTIMLFVATRSTVL